MTAMARISLDSQSSPVRDAVNDRYRRLLGTGLDPINALAHQPQVLEAYVDLHKRLAKWDTVEYELKELAVMAAAVRVGCAWCVDYGYWTAVMQGIPAAKIEAVPVWRDSDLFGDLERQVLGYAEAMSETPPAVSDDMVADLLRHLTEAQLVELTMLIAIENQRARINAALGLTAQGFKEQCQITIE